MTTRTKFELKFLLCIIKRLAPLKASLLFLLEKVKAPPDPEVIKLVTFNNLGRLMGNHSNKSRPLVWRYHEKIIVIIQLKSIF